MSRRRGSTDFIFVPYGEAGEKQIKAKPGGGAYPPFSRCFLSREEMERDHAVQKTPDGILALPYVEVFRELALFDPEFEYFFDDLDRLIRCADELAYELFGKPISPTCSMKVMNIRKSSLSLRKNRYRRRRNA